MRRTTICDAWLGLFGVIGWSVAIPTLAGVAAGIWLDARVESRISWTLTLMLVGVLIGCLTAWRWTRQETGQEKDR
jgi:ATP synthase protein I